jgi:DNA-binding transcriptional LysR family regulator
MDSLDDLAFFAHVVDHGGFAAAERATGVPKSRLSRRIAALEERLGVRLLLRSTRRFAVTDVGRLVHLQARAMLDAAQGAGEAAQRLSSAPRGRVRLSCPVSLAQREMPKLLPAFLDRYPEVRVELKVSNRRVDLMNEGVDIALRVRTRLEHEPDIAIRRFAESGELLVAAPTYLAIKGWPDAPDDLGRHAMLSMSEGEGRQSWELHGPDGARARIEFEPRVAAHDFPLLQSLAEQGVGIALLPEMVCGEAIAAGRLKRVLPEWSLPVGILHAAFPAHRALLPAARALLDHLAEQLPGLLAKEKRDCEEGKARRDAQAGKAKRAR